MRQALGQAGWPCRKCRCRSGAVPGLGGFDMVFESECCWPRFIDINPLDRSVARLETGWQVGQIRHLFETPIKEQTF